MADRFYTGTFEFTQNSRMRTTETVRTTLLFCNVHPAVYERCYPGFQENPPVLLHHAETNEAQAEGIIAVYRALGRPKDVITLESLHEELGQHVDKAKGSSVEGLLNYSVGKLEAVEAYAEAMGIPLAASGLRP